MATTSKPQFSTPLPYGRFHFDYIAEIGRGGLGMVHRIRVTASNAPRLPVGSEWAVKRLNEKWSAHPVMRERFEREIAALKRMSHTNIVNYYGENLPGEERFYVMPIFAKSVRLHISHGGQRGEWREIARLGAILARALQYAHDLGFFHRDFKPDNLLFDGGGPIVIADWGLGYFVHRDSQVLQQLTVGGMGTEYYCSLEQWGTGKCDGRGDIYSLGMTLDEWVTGRQRKITVGAGLNGPTTAETSTGALRFNALLRAMTQEFKVNRPATMNAVATELDAAANS